MVSRRKDPVSPEWSHKVDVLEMGGKPASFDLHAPQGVLADIARRIGVVSVVLLTARVRVSPSAGGIFHVEGQFSAVVEQACVISGEGLTSEISEPFEAWFADRSRTVSFVRAKKDLQAMKTHSEVEILNEKEDPDPLEDGAIDLGELTVQFLCLAIDPYPQKEGAVFEGEKAQKGDSSASGTRKNPFEGLKDWKERR